MKPVIKWAFATACSTMLLGAGLHQVVARKFPVASTTSTMAGVVATDAGTASAAVNASFDLLTSLPESARIAQLTQIANASQISQQRSRARYILANLYLSKRNPLAAIPLLSNLDKDYPILAEYVLLKQAQALAAMSSVSEAKAIWQQILKEYPNSAAAAEALFALGQTQQLLQQFPAHPRSLSVVQTQLQQNPNQVEPMLHMARYFYDREGMIPLLDRLTQSYSNRISPEHWWAIAEGYFNKFEFTKAANAYMRATPNAYTAYRAGRSFQRTRKNALAYTAYSRVALNYPSDPLAPRALIRMMDTSSSSQDAVKIADRIVANYPDTAGEALLKQAEIFQTQLKSPKSASTARNLLLSKYANSEAAAELLWQLAQQQAKTGNLNSALNLVDRIKQNNRKGETAAEAAYWSGKWWLRLGDRAKANQAFEYTIATHPTSYFAWRSASQLGWQVGDFATVRNLNPVLSLPSIRHDLPAGDAVLNELYLLGQDRDASDRWQVQSRGKLAQNPKEIFTDGVLRIGINDNLRGISQVESLTWLDVNPTEKADINAIMQKPTFWQSLYPFPYWQIVTAWSANRNLNPALVISLMRQESRFEAQILSSAGAVGLMQVMPETGAWIATKAGEKNYSLKNPEDNIKFGTWYLDYTHHRYANNSMLAVASYNAGPGAVAGWVKSGGIGDPDDFADRIPYAETKGYIKHVFENYWNYLRLYSPAIQQQVAQLQAKSPRASLSK